MDRSSPRQEPHRWRGRASATALSAGVHAAAAAALLIGWRTAGPPVFMQPIAVSFAPLLPLAPREPPAPPSPKRERAAPPLKHAAVPRLADAQVVHKRRDHPPPLAIRPTPATPASESPPIVAASETDDGLSDAQIAGAQAAGEGQGAGPGGDGGGACDMARRVQAAVRKDPLARAAIHSASGRALVIWNGDWVQHGGEDGKGLAAVREAITWEVAFAPPACRRQHVRGLVLLSLADGSARLALGAGDWRWSDLLGLR